MNLPCKLTPLQKEKIDAAQKYLQNSSDPNALYTIVVLIGPSLFGSLFRSNSDTAWSKIEDPGLFRFAEMQILSSVFQLSMPILQELMDRQLKYNQEELRNNRPIGRKKYQTAKANSKKEN